jgi:YHS domain-containing protein
MKNMVKIAAVAIVAVFCVSSLVYAASDMPGGAQSESKVVDVGNKICPVTGEKVDGNTFYTYNGKRYGFCCSMCPGIFAKDPAKYAAIAEKEASGE